MYKDVPLTDIVDNPFQPRGDFDKATIRSLADEIAAEGFWNGTLQGRRNARGRIELVFGHRRLRALRLLKIPSVHVELLNLTDDQMAVRALEENLQREGLKDFEKADAVKAAVDLERQRRKTAGESERGASETIAKRLGLDAGWVAKLCAISLSIDNEERSLIDGAISAKTALAAKEWGGKRYMRTLVRQAKAATKPDAKVSKPTENTVAAMKRAIKTASDDVRTKLEESIFSGELITPEQVDRAARRERAAQVRRRKPIPPDLKVVIVGWTDDLNDWTKKLKTVAPYMDYVEEEPTTARKFRAALKQLIDVSTELLKAASVK